MSFGYWCRPCKEWWDAKLNADLTERVRRIQRSWPNAISPLSRPGQSFCPRCGLESTQELPTEGTI